MIPEGIKKEILGKATLEAACQRYLQPYPDGKRWHYTCPLCGKESEFSPKKNIYKCFHCDLSAAGEGGAVSLLMKAEHLDYPAAMEKLAADFGVPLPQTEQPDKPKAKAEPKSFCHRQLDDSGLTPADVRATWHYGDDEREKVLMPFRPQKEQHDDSGRLKMTTSPFQRGTVANGMVTGTGDDMIIQYLNLDGHPETYNPSGKEGDERPFYRIRWQNPEAHLTQDGSICKYKSPYKSGLHLYIPERLRSAYRKGEAIDDLFFTEGEKKAEAVSKYVGPAFGMGGINSLVGKESRQMPESVVRIVKECGVKRVYFIMDADWNDLSSHIGPDKDVMTRPKTFFAAAKNFRDWFRTLQNADIYLDVFLILGKNTGKAKGVDDQLMLLRPDTDRYLASVRHGTNAAVAGGSTDLFDVVKISSIPDAKLAELWHLNDADDFCQAHLDQLRTMESFTIQKNVCRINELGNRELVYGLMDDETFWNQTQTKDSVKYSFNYERAYRFLQRRGYYKMRTDGGDYKLVHHADHLISDTNKTEIQDYVIDFVRGYKREGVDKEEVLNMLHRAKAQYLGEYSLSSLLTREPEYAKPSRDSQVLIFATKYWRITADGVEEKDLTAADFDYWESDKKRFDAHRLEHRLINLSEEDGDLQLSFGPDAADCNFLDFLIRASWFTWDKHMDEHRRYWFDEVDSKITDYVSEYKLSLLSKLTAIGYLLHQYNNQGVQKAIIAMDERISPVGDSQGRSGKSLMGAALEQMVNLVNIPGKGLDLVNDRFTFEQVTSQTRVILLDDLDMRFDFELLFPLITGSVQVNAKGKQRFSLTGHQKPKFLLTTNHAILGSSGSFRDRQFKVAFSNYFDEDYKPEMVYGCQFWSEDWDQKQWNLFYNLMAECVELYLLAQKHHWGVGGSGLIECPSENLDKRLLRQEMTEGFYDWMVKYLNIDELDPHNVSGTRLNQRIERIEMYNSYLMELTEAERRWMKPNKFLKQTLLFCRYYEYVLNPQFPRDAKGNPIKSDKSGGTEYFTIGTPENK